jgi:two-component system sensor histidine kinase KdpD
VKNQNKTNQNWREIWKLALPYLKSVLVVIAASIISIPVHYIIEPVNLVMIYLAAVIVSAIFLGQGPTLLASILSVLMFDFFFVEPHLSFTVVDTQYLLTFFGLVAVGAIISNTTAKLRNQLATVRQREANTAALSSLSQDLTGLFNLQDMLSSVVNHVSQSFDCPAVVWLPQGDRLHVAASSTSLNVNDAEMAYVHEIFQGETMKEGLHHTNLCCLPLKIAYKTAGVLGILLKEKDQLEFESQKHLLQGFANLTALAIERASLAEQASQAQVLQQTERLQSALLHSISHELRTPLVSITGTLSALAELRDQSVSIPEEQRLHEELIDTAYEEAQRLNLLVGNLLDMSRLEAGAVKLSLEPCDIVDLVGITLRRFSEINKHRIIHVDIADGLPLINLDVALMVQVLNNLLVNAAKYSPEDTPIDIHSIQMGNEVLMQVSDQGLGVPEVELDKIFQKFYRSPTTQRYPGLGLGLSISKGIVEAHSGRIWAENRLAGGLTINLAFPIT